MLVSLACCLLFLFPCCSSQSVTIGISPDEIYVDSSVTITCIASASSNTLLSLVPLYLINGTYVQYSCIGDSEFQPLTQNFSTLPYTPTGDSTLSARISLSPASASDDGLSIGCAFYNPVAEMVASSDVITLSVLGSTTPTISQVNTTEVTITDLPIVNSLGFQIGVGSVGGVILLLVIIAVLLILIIPVVVCLVKSKRRKQSSPVRAVALDLSSTTSPVDQASNPALKQQEPGSFIKNATDSLKADNEKEFADRYTATRTNPVFANKQAQPDDIIKSVKLENEKEFADRYTALPTYSVVVNADAEHAQLSASTDPSIPHQFSSIDVDIEKKEL